MRRGHRYLQILRLLIALTTLFLAGHASGQECPPQTLHEIINMLEKKAEESDIIKLIQQYRVDFVLTEQSSKALASAHATQPIITAIKDNPFRILWLTFPQDNFVVTQNILVYGRSRRVPNKHLWLFVHPLGKSDWVPQGDEVALKANCDFDHAVYVGRPGDPKGDFVVRAVWLDLKGHQEL